MDSKTDLRVNYFYLIIIALIGIGCGGQDSSMNTDYTSFKIEDTASIGKIKISNKNGSQVGLLRTTDGWEIEGLGVLARKDLIEVTLATLRRMEVKEFIPKNGQQEIFKRLSVYGSKIEIFGQNDAPIRTFFVGGPTQNHLGTYMMLEGSDVPVIVYVPGFRGYLTNHFNPNVLEWKSKQIFTHHIRDIKSVEVIHHRNPQASFRIDVLSPSTFSLIQLQNGKKPSQADTSMMKVFLQNFKVLGFENWVDVNSVRLDSVQSKYSLYTVRVTTQSNTVNSVKLCAIPLPKGTLNMLGEPIQVDVDRMYGILKNGEVTMCQYFTFDPVTIPLDYFVRGQVPSP